MVDGEWGHGRFWRYELNELTKPMNESQQLRESMWDLVYGLLSEDESQALITRIKSDPQAARLYAEVRLQAELIGQASQIQDSSLVFNADAAARAVVSNRAKSASATERAGSTKTRQVGFQRAGAWLAGVGATALAALCEVGLVWTRSAPQQLASNFISTDVMAQRSMTAGLTSKIAIRTYLVRASDEPADGASAAVDLRLVDSAGQER